MKKLINLLLFAFVTNLHGQIPGELDTVEYIECVLIPRTPQSNGNGHHSYPRTKLINGTSGNWSGYAAATSLTSPTSGSVTAVSGSWTVPSLIATPDNSYCAIWVGIDGYKNATIEQIGTGHNWLNNAQTNFAWYEMYPSASYTISGFPVNPGDVITGSVTYSKNGIFTMKLTNVTRNVTTTIPTTKTTNKSALRSSAEWIVEAPSNNGVLPLADFGTVGFTNCTCTINRTTGSINNTHWVNDAITMMNPSLVVKASPSNLSTDGKSFSDTWHHE